MSELSSPYIPEHIISDAQAHAIAAKWYAGQASYLYALRSSGTIDKEEVLWEIHRAMSIFTPAKGFDNFRGVDDINSLVELCALEKYVHVYGDRDPIEGWHKLWDYNPPLYTQMWTGE